MFKNKDKQSIIYTNEEERHCVGTVMDHKPLPIGIDNFEKLITRGYYFIDKSLLIKDLLDNKASVNLFTRPIGSKNM